MAKDAEYNKGAKKAAEDVSGDVEYQATLERVEAARQRAAAANAEHAAAVKKAAKAKQ